MPCKCFKLVKHRVQRLLRRLFHNRSCVATSGLVPSSDIESIFTAGQVVFSILLPKSSRLTHREFHRGQWFGSGGASLNYFLLFMLQEWHMVQYYLRICSFRKTNMDCDSRDTVQPVVLDKTCWPSPKISFRSIHQQYLRILAWPHNWIS